MEERQISDFVVITLGMFITWLSVGLRCYVRIFVSRTFGSDDYWMVLALFLFTAASGIGYTGIHYGIGVHAKNLNYNQLINGAKYEVVLELIYIFCTVVIKTSVGLLLLRITSVKPFYKYLIWYSIAILWVWALLTFIVVCLQCRPLEAVWNPLVQGKCLEPSLITAFAYAISAETIFFDWFFSLLPIPMLWNIKMTTQLKISVMAILSVGIVASSATIVRLKYLVAFENLTDPLYSISPVFLWSSIELSLGITAASIATLRPLLRSWHIIGFTSDRDSSNDPQRPRSSGGFRKQSSNLHPKSSHSSSGLNSPQENRRFSNLHMQPSASAGSEQGILGRGSKIYEGNENLNGGRNERSEERYNEEFEMIRQHDEESLRTDVQVEYIERMRHLDKDMV
ncbi:hypothetical protein MFRU_011g01830 [Monilinia fructicola]|nr:hypothetical protein MFRU_011g01830 [Monilinia fructicola]